MSSTPVPPPVLAVPADPLELHQQHQALKMHNQALMCMFESQQAALASCTTTKKKTDDDGMNFTPEEVCIILDTIEEEIPFGAAGWDKVAERVNASFARKGIRCVRTTYSIKSKFR